MFHYFMLMNMINNKATNKMNKKIMLPKKRTHNHKKINNYKTKKIKIALREALQVNKKETVLHNPIPNNKNNNKSMKKY